MNGSRRQAARPVRAARFEGFCIGRGILFGPQFRQHGLGKQRNEVILGDFRVALERARRDGRLDMGQPLVEKSRERRPGRLDVTPAIETLECELIDRRRFRSRSEARMAVLQFIEGFCNPSPRHSALGDLSPIEYESKQDRLSKPA